MRTTFLPGPDLNIPLLGFGCMRLPTAGGYGDIDEPAAQAMVDRAMENGINYFDTAWPYHEGKSESFLAKALKKYPRESYFLATKLPIWEISKPEDVEKYFSQQLEKFGVDYFDFYLVHNLNKQNYDIMVQNMAYGQLMAKKHQGKIKNLGFSFHDEPYMLEEICNAFKWDFAQIQLNYVDWKDIEAEKLYETLTRRDIPAIIMEPVRGGTLASLCPQSAEMLSKERPGASLASWALRYAGSLPGVLTVLSGMSSMEQLDDNIKTFTNFEPLSDAEHELLEKAADVFRKSGSIGCTSCQYCVPCPFNVDIPRILSFYNHYSRSKNWYDFTNLYCTMPKSEQAHNCVDCGACLPKCPQSLPIPELMGKIAAFAKEGGM